MGKKKGGVTKTQAVKDYLEQHSDATATEVVDVLGRRGIHVSTSLVSNTKSEMRKQSRAAGAEAPMPTKKTAAGTKKGTQKKAVSESPARPAPTAAAPAESPTAPAGRGEKLSADDLFEAKKLADELGGIDKARQALDYLERLR